MAVRSDSRSATPSSPKPGTRPASPMAVPRSRIRPACARMALILPICAIRTATNSSRSRGRRAELCHKRDRPSWAVPSPAGENLGRTARFAHSEPAAAGLFALTAIAGPIALPAAGKAARGRSFDAAMLARRRKRLTARRDAQEIPPMTIDVATGIARILKQEGVGWVSTFPVCRVNNALGREGVPMLMMRDDRYAVAVADAFSRITAGAKIGVATFQGGVNAAGMQYAYAGMAQAFEDGSPVLCITDGVPAGASGNSQYDVASAMKTVSKWFGYLDRPERTPELMRRAFTMLRSGRPGPVILAIPNATATYDETADPYRPVKGWKTAPDPADVKTAIDLFLQARNPLIYAGEGVIYAAAADELKALAELVNAPVITTLKAKGAFPEDHKLFVGVRGDQVGHYLNKSDLILAIGTSLSPGRFSHAIPDAPTKTIIHCNVDELHINKMYPTAHAVIGDARLTLQALCQEASSRGAGGRTTGDVAAEVKAARDQALARYRQVMNSDEKPINPYRVYGDLMQVLDLKNSFVTHESGNTRDQLSTVFDTLIPRGFLGWGNVSTLGFSLAAAIAAKKAFPERASVAVTGEAGLGYMLGNLEVLLREKLGVTIAHISNGALPATGPASGGRDMIRSPTGC